MKLFKNLAGSVFTKEPEVQEKKMPLGIKIGSVIELDHLDWKLLGDKTKFTDPDTTMIVDRYGHIKLTPSTEVYRFYTKDNSFLELVLEYNEIEEIKLFIPHDTVIPYSEEDWEFWVGDNANIGQPNFELKCKTAYERVWMEDTEGAVYPVEMDETIHFMEDDEVNTVSVQHMSMMYGRWVSDETPEWLLVSAEDRGEVGSVELYLGKDMSDTDIRVI